jgi:hypothetical protein
MTIQKTNQFAKDYIDVATRIAEFRRLDPNGSLQPVNPLEPIKIINVADKTYLEYVAAAYRTPEDEKPGIGIAWELIPGKTPFTRDSEAANAETSAWGRAIVAALAADTKHGVASLEEVELSKARQETPEKNNNNKASEAQVKKISILRRELNLDDSVYREQLNNLYNVNSSKDLSVSQAANLIEKLVNAQAKKGA